jgi:diketogulonate reductase-like aldo/keto reductase
MSFGKTIKLNDGNVMPRIGLGTWLSEPVRGAAVRSAAAC